MQPGIESTFEQLLHEVEQMPPIDATLKLVVEDYLFVIDGKGEQNLISTSDTDTECTVRTDIDTFIQMKSGHLDPVDALMDQKLTIDGSFGTAFRLKYLIS